MEKEERSSFEKEMVANPTLQKQMEEVKSLIQGVEAAVLKERLNLFHEDTANDAKTSELRAFDFRKYAMAASVAILIGIASFWYISRQGAYEKIYNSHFSPDPGLPTTMSISSNYDFYEAMVDYKTKEYTTAIVKWELLLEEKRENDTLNYFLGVAHLANDNAEVAIPYLNKTLDHPGSMFKDDSYYYLGMAHLKTGDVKQAKVYLKQSTKPKSKTILSELE